MISDPQHKRFYSGELNERMPAFIKNPEKPAANVLGPSELRLLVDWLRGEWYEPQAATHLD